MIIKKISGIIYDFNLACHGLDCRSCVVIGFLYINIIISGLIS